MLKRFASYWWFLTISGALLSILGLTMLFDNEFGLADLLRYLGFVLIGMGIFTGLINYILHRRNGASDWRWYLLAAGELALGMIILTNNTWAETTFIQVIGIWSGMMGLYLLIDGLRKKTRSIIVSLSGLVSLVFGAVIVLEALEARETQYLVAIYAVLLGLYLVNGSLKIRKWNGIHHPAAENSADGDKTGES